jgi:hypothetical protein
METNSSGDTVLTQWFERARFEYHPNNPAAFRVLLGLLGNEVRGNSAPTLAPSGVPAVTYIDRDGVVYEHEGSGQNRRIGSLPYLGRVLDAVRIGNRIVVLREQGLQSIVAGQQATTIATFTGAVWSTARCLPQLALTGSSTRTPAAQTRQWGSRALPA